MASYAVFTMLYHDGTIKDSFREEGKPDRESDTWITWKSLKILENLYNAALSQEEYECTLS